MPERDQDNGIERAASGSQASLDVDSMKAATASLAPRAALTSSPDPGMLSDFLDLPQQEPVRAQPAFQSERKLSEREWVKIGAELAVNNTNMTLDEKLHCLREHQYNIIADAINEEAKQASKSGTQWQVNGELVVTHKPNRQDIKGLSVTFPAKADAQFPDAHTWEIEGVGDANGFELQLWNPELRVSGKSMSWDLNSTAPPYIAADIRKAIEQTPEFLELAIEDERVVGRTAVPDPGPLEPWKVQAWAQDLRNRHEMAVGLDTETTGFGGSVVEVGVVDSEGKELFHAYVQPLEPIVPEATNVHGLTAESLAEKGARPWAEVAPALAEILRGKHVVQYAENLFDKSALERSDQLAGVEPSAPRVQWVDAMGPYQHQNGFHKTMKLIDAAADHGVGLKQEEAHGALADARATMGLIKGMAGRQVNLSPEEGFLHKGAQGLEVFNQKGARVDRSPEQLQEILDQARGTWEKPRHGLQSLEKGAFIKVSLDLAPALEPRKDPKELIDEIASQEAGGSGLFPEIYAERFSCRVRDLIENASPDERPGLQAAADAQGDYDPRAGIDYHWEYDHEENDIRLIDYRDPADLPPPRDEAKDRALSTATVWRSDWMDTVDRAGQLRPEHQARAVVAQDDRGFHVLVVNKHWSTVDHSEWESTHPTIEEAKTAAMGLLTKDAIVPEWESDQVRQHRGDDSTDYRAVVGRSGSTFHAGLKVQTDSWYGWSTDWRSQAATIEEAQEQALTFLPKKDE